MLEFLQFFVEGPGSSGALAFLPFLIGGAAAAGAAAQTPLGQAALDIWSQDRANDQNVALARESMAFSAAQQEKAQAFNKEEAALNRAWQERMSGTSYQRSMEDLRKAGLNPMLAYMKGGASTPAGGQGSTTPVSGNVGRVESVKAGAAMRAGLSSALDVRRLKKELDQTDSNIALNHAIEAAKGAEEQLNKHSADAMREKAKQEKARTGAVEAQSKLEKKRAEVDEATLYYDKGVEKLERLLGVPFGSIGRIFKHMGKGKGAVPGKALVP